MKRRTTLVIIGALVCVLALALSGCTSAKKTSSTVAAPKLAELGAKVEGELTNGYPDALPLWEGAKVVSSDHTTQGEFEVYDFALSTQDPFDTVLYGYTQGLQKAGFTVEQTEEDANLKTITATNGTISAFITFTTNEQATQVSASVQM